MCQQKKNKNSNQAQRSGDFMRQKWRIYGLSYTDNLARTGRNASIGETGEVMELRQLW
jgi:hypothetical protein